MADLTRCIAELETAGRALRQALDRSREPDVVDGLRRQLAAATEAQEKAEAEREVARGLLREAWLSDMAERLPDRWFDEAEKVVTDYTTEAAKAKEKGNGDG